jgi:hypothetical protein
MARASRRMAASPNLLPWFETARIAAKCTQAAPAMARLLTVRPSALELAPKPPRLKDSQRAVPHRRAGASNSAHGVAVTPDGVAILGKHVPDLSLFRSCRRRAGQHRRLSGRVPARHGRSWLPARGGRAVARHRGSAFVRAFGARRGEAHGDLPGDPEHAEVERNEDQQAGI